MLPIPVTALILLTALGLTIWTLVTGKQVPANVALLLVIILMLISVIPK